MIPDLKEIKSLRKRLNLTQQELAAAAGVSQSLIAKIEAEKVDPTYANAVKILNTLYEYGQKSEPDIRKLMQRKIICVPPETKIAKAVETMKKYGISQLPVVHNDQVVGMVSEAIILDSLLEHRGTFVKDVMQEPPPIVSLNTDSKVVSQLLRHFPIVLISEKGKLKGVVTKSDLLSGL
jgi:predicted transcriptional regulator